MFQNVLQQALMRIGNQRGINRLPFNNQMKSLLSPTFGTGPAEVHSNPEPLRQANPGFSSPDGNVLRGTPLFNELSEAERTNILNAMNNMQGMERQLVSNYVMGKGGMPNNIKQYTPSYQDPFAKIPQPMQPIGPDYAGIDSIVDMDWTSSDYTKGPPSMTDLATWKIDPSTGQYIRNKPNAPNWLKTGLPFQMPTPPTNPTDYGVNTIYNANGNNTVNHTNNWLGNALKNLIPTSNLGGRQLQGRPLPATSTYMHPPNSVNQLNSVSTGAPRNNWLNGTMNNLNRSRASIGRW